MNQELKAVAAMMKAGKQVIAVGEMAEELPKSIAADCVPFLRNPDDAAKVRAVIQKEIEKALIAGFREAGFLPNKTGRTVGDGRGRGRRVERGT